MNKKLIVLLLVLAVCVLIPFGNAFAEEDKPCDTTCKLCECVKTIDKVKDCKAVVVHGNAFIAVKLGGIASKTTADAVISQIESRVKEQFPCITQVYVSNSVKAFAAMDSFEKGVKLDEIVKMFDIDLSRLLPPRDYVKPDEVRLFAPDLSCKYRKTSENRIENKTLETERDDKEKLDIDKSTNKPNKRINLPFELDKNKHPQALPWRS